MASSRWPRGLGAEVALGATTPFAHVWIVEGLILVTMVGVVLPLAMEVVREPPLIRFCPMLGCRRVTVLIGITLLDDLTR